MFTSLLPRSKVNCIPASQETSRVSVMFLPPSTWSKSSQTDSRRPWISDDGNIRWMRPVQVAAGPAPGVGEGVAYGGAVTGSASRCNPKAFHPPCKFFSHGGSVSALQLTGRSSRCDFLEFERRRIVGKNPSESSVRIGNLFRRLHLRFGEYFSMPKRAGLWWGSIQIMTA